MMILPFYKRRAQDISHLLHVTTAGRLLSCAHVKLNSDTVADDDRGAKKSRKQLHLFLQCKQNPIIQSVSWEQE
jgi:hypothetical protein